MHRQFKLIVFGTLLILLGMLGLNYQGLFLSSKIQWPSIVTPTNIEDGQTEMQKEESQEKIKGHLHKEFIYSPDNVRNFIFLHGFSASRGEISPVVETLGRDLKANIYFTRLAGHGLSDPEAMGRMSYRDWFLDLSKAMSLVEKTQKPTSIICASTGCAIAILYILDHPDRISSLIMLSPNFRPKELHSWLAIGPLGRLVTRLIVGEHRSFEPKNPLVSELWTTSYPSRAISEMMDLLALLRNRDLKELKLPVAVFYSPKDEVVSVPLILEKFEEIGSLKKFSFNVTGADDHVLAGDAQSPQTTDTVIFMIKNFLNFYDRTTIDVEKKPAKVGQ